MTTIVEARHDTKRLLDLGNHESTSLNEFARVNMGEVKVRVKHERLLNCITKTIFITIKSIIFKFFDLFAML